jgi:hypothetical protein
MAGWQGMPQAAGPEMEGENGAPVIDMAELLAAVDRLTQNGTQPHLGLVHKMNLPSNEA